MRISIIGQPASGKSALAKRISEKLAIPHLHIDRLYFAAGGHELSSNDEAGKERVRAHIYKEVESLIEQESWVSDGWYARPQSIIASRATEIVYLDIPFYRRLYNHVCRAIFDDRHEELNLWDELTFPLTMIKRIFTHGPNIRAFAKAHAHKVITLRSYREVEQYLEQL